MERMLSEYCGVKSGLLADINGGAETARVSLKEGRKLALIVSAATAISDLVVTARQHDAAAAGNSKDLILTQSYFKKVAAETAFTKVAAPGTAIVTDAGFNGAVGVAVFEITAEDLDVNGGFSHVSLLFTQGAVARLVSVEQILHETNRKAAYELNL